MRTFYPPCRIRRPHGDKPFLKAGKRYHGIKTRATNWPKVRGVATAAGCQLVASCDLAVAEDTARFAVSGINAGLFCSTPMVALSRNVSRKHAMRMLLTGDIVPADNLAYLLKYDSVQGRFNGQVGSKKSTADKATSKRRKTSKKSRTSKSRRVVASKSPKPRKRVKRRTVAKKSTPRKVGKKSYRRKTRKTGAWHGSAARLTGSFTGDINTNGHLCPWRLLSP